MGQLRGIRVHPARGEPGEDLEQAEVGVHGLTGDRPKRSPVHLVAESDADARANLVLSLSADELYAAVGGRVRVGEVVLRVTARPSGCPGVYADVVTTGQVRVGDPAEVVPSDQT